MKVTADTSVCQGHQLCQGEARDVFGFDEDRDVVVVLVEHPDESRRADVTLAVKYCPAFALSIEEAQSIEEALPIKEDADVRSDA